MMKRWVGILALLAAAAGLSAGGMHWGILQSLNDSVADLSRKIPTSTPGPTATITPTFSISPTFSVSPTFTCTPTASPSSTASPTASPTATVTPTSTPYGPLTLSTSLTLTAGTYYFTSVHILAGGSLFVSGLSAVTLMVSGDFSLDSGGLVQGTGLGYGQVSGPGYAGAPGYYATVGAGHGGQGGANVWHDAVGPTYDSATAPILPGSGDAGAGGAALRIAATGNVYLNGSIHMDGVLDTTFCGGGGGAGGSVYVTAQNIYGSGTISADGSKGGDCPSFGPNTEGGGGGGGGRINLCAAGSYAYTGSSTVLGGLHGCGLSCASSGSVGTNYRCSAAAPTPTSTPTPGATLSLWKSCASTNLWYGHTIASLGLFNGSFSGCAGLNCPSVTDALSGDSTVQGMSAAGGGGVACAAAGPWNYSFGFYAPSGASDASSYQNNGHLLFDLRLGAGAISSINVGIGNAYPSTITATVALTPASYNSSSFTLVSIPISSFSPDVTHSMNMPFIITVGMSSAPAASDELFYVDDVRWTPN
jgi:hypothetical protein